MTIFGKSSINTTPYHSFKNYIFKNSMNYKSNEDDASLPRLPQQNTLEGWLKQQKYFLTVLEAESTR